MKLTDYLLFTEHRCVRDCIEVGFITIATYWNYWNPNETYVFGDDILKKKDNLLNFSLQKKIKIL